MKIAFSFLLAVAPAVLLVWYFHRQDRKKPEPAGMVLKVFLLGIVITLPAVLLERLVSTGEVLVSWSPFLRCGFHAFVVAACCEEFLKLLLVLRVPYRSAHFDEVMDGIIYTIVASLGFACMENILYVLNSGWEIAVLRAFTAVPLHALASGMMGYYIGMARFAPGAREERALILKGFLVAVLIHGTYNMLLFSASLYPPYVALGIFPLLVLVFARLRRNMGFAVKRDLRSGRL